jgi:hypothetical protein
MPAANPFPLRALYLYAVCLVMLLVSVFSIVGAVSSVVNLVYPDPYATTSVTYPDDPRTGGQIEQERLTMERSMRRGAVIELVGALTLTAIAVPTYIYHWRRVQQDRRDQTSSPDV